MTRRKKLIHFTFKETLHVVNPLIRTIKQREPLCKTTAADNQMKQRDKGTLYAAGARDVSSCFVNQDLSLINIKISDRFGISISFFFSLFSGCVSDKGMTEVGLGLMSAVAD